MSGYRGRRFLKGTRLGFAKQFVAGQLLRRVLRYVGKNPERNLPRLIDLGERLALLERHKQQIRAVRQAVLGNPVLHAYVTRLLRGTHPNVQRHLLFNFFLNELLFGIPRQGRVAERLGVNVPAVILVDPTSACNLRCTGCWAGMYDKCHTLSYARLDRLAGEAKELGIYWFVMSGGEPFLYPRLLEFCAKHNDMAFMVYTNGTLIDEDRADRILECGNVSPAFSLEGPREMTDARRGAGVFDKVSHAMDLLRERGVPFGFSLTLTRQNCETLMGDEFVDWLIEKGCRYGWTFHYIPIGADVNTDLLVTPAQRAWLAHRVPEIRAKKPLLFADFWNDGEMTLGCIAGGRRYFHIAARGDVEPCAFVHFAVDNINDISLLQALESPLFKAYQKRQPFSDNLLRPCPLIDVPGALRDIIRESGARPTHPGADGVVRDEKLCCFIDSRAADWERVSADIWAARQAARQAPQGPAQAQPQVPTVSS